jgi:hypothetical protein
MQCSWQVVRAAGSDRHPPTGAPRFDRRWRAARVCAGRGPLPQARGPTSGHDTNSTRDRRQPRDRAGGLPPAGRRRVGRAPDRPGRGSRKGCRRGAAQAGRKCPLRAAGRRRCGHRGRLRRATCDGRGGRGRAGQQGIYPTQPFVQVPEPVLHASLGVNLLGAFRTCRAFVPAMAERGYGRVVNVSSSLGRMCEGRPGAPAYGIAKTDMGGPAPLATSRRGPPPSSGLPPSPPRAPRMGSSWTAVQSHAEVDWRNVQPTAPLPGLRDPGFPFDEVFRVPPTAPARKRGHR